MELVHHAMQLLEFLRLIHTTPAVAPGGLYYPGAVLTAATRRYETVRP